MRYFLLIALIFCSPDAVSNPSPQSRYAGICGRRCGSGSRSAIPVTVVDALAKRRTHDRIYVYSSGNPAIICRCHSQVVRHRTRADREITEELSSSCATNCRRGTRLFTDVIVVEADGSEHTENISILQYDYPIACLCGNIGQNSPPLPRGHPRDH